MAAAHLELEPRSITHTLQECHLALLQAQCSVMGAMHGGGVLASPPTPPSLFEACWAGGLALTRWRSERGSWFVSPA